MLLFSIPWMLIIYIVGQLTIEKTGYDDGDGYDAWQDCGDLLSGCYGEEGTTAQKDHQVFSSENYHVCMKIIRLG